MTLLTATGLRSQQGLLALQGLKSRTGLLVGGGPVVPSWVTALRAPSGDLPLIVSLFHSAQYYRADIGICALSDVWEQNTNWGIWDPATYLVPGQGIAGGPDISPIAGSAVLTGGAKALVIATGYTVVGQCTFPLVPDQEPTVEPGVFVNLPAFDSSVTLGISPLSTGPDYQHALLTSYSFALVPSVENITYFPMGGSKGACTCLLDYSGAASIDGAATITVPAIIGAPQLTDIGNYVSAQGPQTVYARWSAIYAPQPNGDLPALSAL